MIFWHCAALNKNKEKERAKRKGPLRNAELLEPLYQCQCSASTFDPFDSSQPVGSAVIDPRSRKPARAALGATVRAPSCMLADALTKVVMVAGSSAAPLLEHYRAGALVVAAGGIVQMTRDLQSAMCLAA
jgi:thiamine biosynthesis lipoprotein